MDVVPSSCTSDGVPGDGGGAVGHPVGRVDVPGPAKAGSTVEQVSAPFGRAYSVHADGLAAVDAATKLSSGGGAVSTVYWLDYDDPGSESLRNPSPCTGKLGENDRQVFTVQGARTT